MTNRQIFLNHIGQTSPDPLALEIVRAKDCNLYDLKGKTYIDLIGGISVCNIGHSNPKVIKAIQQQADNFMHVMVNGELILSPQTAYARALVENLPPSLNSVFFTTSGTEATEGAMKLAKRFTGRTHIAAFKNSYHGSTQGSLSILGDEYWRNAFRPLLPAIVHLEYNHFDCLELITEETACVIAETIQAEAGVIVPEKEWMQALRKKCTDTGTLLVLDEIQCGFGRNGTLWAFEQFDIVPDVLLLGKALGGGMPLGAFIADKKIMDCLTNNPVLGHINTFGGHPVCCAAGLAAFEVLKENKLAEKVLEKEKLFLSNLTNISGIKKIRSRGLMIALQFGSFEQNKKVIDGLLEEGVFTDWFLFAPECLRIVPPLIITEDEIRTSSEAIKKVVPYLK
ncbi:aspartate aminotransferase family protein [Hanamia caeni]|jgi:acetylornithine/succinyldiaminopimelate/putrescine aminotransferase|uniref:Aspartate aminotransferase family protein n=1 Tax=Hanamia caeni TaxID=2294116 RepID=A0A3M9NMQ2_9BACT|nr:aminotransferase class III-fold pyridoxal phosphate-dependent enzyme [Hanamia caeni]RNI39066.1 aspartate aminotransferase family protein [Hanamia caeni]